MSNDLSYRLNFRSNKRITLTQVIRYLTAKKQRWDGRGSKTAEEILLQEGLKNPAEVVTWGFGFGKIRQQPSGTYSVSVSSWANENSRNVWISGREGELRFLLDQFPDLSIEGEFEGEEVRGLVHGYQLIEQEKARRQIPVRVRKGFNRKATAALFEAIHDDNYCDHLPEGLSAAFFAKSLKDGADPNGRSGGLSLFEHLMRNPAIFGAGDHNETETRKTIEVLLENGMRLQQAAHFAALLPWVSGLPDQVREFARKQKLLRATEDKTRLEVLRFGIAKGGLGFIRADFLAILGPLAQQDRNFVKLALREDGDTLSGANKAIRSDKQLVLVAVSSKFGNAIVHVSARLRDDPEVALAAMRNSGRAFQYLSKRLRNEPAIALLAVPKSGWVLQFASKMIRNNRDIVKEAVKQAGSLAFGHASKALRRDPEIQRLHQAHASYDPSLI